VAATTNGERGRLALGDMSMLVAVTSAPGNDALRDTIRRTWMRRAARLAPRWRLVFVIGRPGQPASLEGDTLWIDLEESYEHLPRKTHATIRWFLDNGGFDLLFKTDDDCYVNVWELARFVPGALEYFGGISGRRQHKPDYHFGRTTKDAVLDTSLYEGPWASGSGYCLTPSAAREVMERLTSADAERLVFEDKMIGDTLRHSSVNQQFHNKWSALTLDKFADYKLDAGGYVASARLRLPLRPLMPSWKVYHLGTAGGGRPLYRMRHDVLVALAEALDRSLSLRRAISSVMRGLRGALRRPSRG
jgi:hypothetical protein